MSLMYTAKVKFILGKKRLNGNDIPWKYFENLRGVFFDLIPYKRENKNEGEGRWERRKIGKRYGEKM